MLRTGVTSEGTITLISTLPFTLQNLHLPSRRALSWLLKQGLLVIELPSSQPDGPLYLGTFRGKGVAIKPQEHAMKAAIEREWSKINVDSFQAIITSFEKRPKACMKTKGDDFEQYLG
ncbi:hypothetical protein Y032_0036g3252 [Ancylostoma ceylanicum]|nr:hypothetical protein Y032_0036g3252 [Ancylostoma ceylanicum]